MGEMSFGPLVWALAALGAVAAIAYGAFFLNRPPSFLRALVKTVFMAAFAGALVNAHAPFPLVLAVVASAFGDFFLAFDKKWVLPLGILSFLLAQLVYTLMFTAIWFFSGDNAPLWPRYAAMAGVGLFLLSFLIWFWRIEEFKRAPILSTLAIAALVAFGLLMPVYVVGGLLAFTGDADSRPPLAALAPLAALVLAAIALAVLRRKLGAVPLVAMVYAGVITVMAAAAMWLPWIGWPAMAGAALFLVSDLVLAAELFRLPADAAARRITAPVVWWTYAAAQIGIIAGVVLIARTGG